MARRGRSLTLAPLPWYVRQWWKLTWPLGMWTGILRTSAPLYAAFSSSIWSSSERSRSAKCREVLSASAISFHRWLPSTIVIVPISSPQSWKGMNAVSISSEVEVDQ